MKTPQHIQDTINHCQVIVEENITHGSVELGEAKEILSWWDRVQHPPVIMQLLPFTHYKPRCPFCSQQMVAARIELPDRSKLIWQCECDGDDRDDIRKEIEEEEYVLGNAG